MNYLRPLRKMAGFTLVELMVALVLSSFLVLGMVQVFSASRTAYQSSMGVSRTQESSRFSMDFISGDIRMAGHMGCFNDQARFVNDPPTLISHFLTSAEQASLTWSGATYGLRFEVPIQGYEATGTAPGDTATVGAIASAWAGSPALPASLTDATRGLIPVPLANSDILVLRFFSADSTPLGFTTLGVVTSGSTETVTFPVTLNLTSPNYGMYGIADCATATVLEATSSSQVASTAGVYPNKSPFSIEAYGNPLAATVQGYTNLYPAQSMVYYVGIRTTGNTGNVPSLFRARFNPGATLAASTWTAEELVEGVEMMQLTYGRDTHTGKPDGGVDVFDTASSNNAGVGALGAESNGDLWRRVGAVRIGFLIRSSERASSSTHGATAPVQARLVVNGVTVTAPEATDGALHVAYNNTIALRNRLYGN